MLDPLRIPKGANLVNFLSPDWVRRGELFGPEALSPDAPAILEAFEKVLEELRNLHALFRAEIYAGDTDAPGEYLATDTADTKSKPKRTRGKNIPKNVEKAVLNWLDVAMDGTVKKADGTDMTGELAADGWRGAFDAFSESDACTARIRKYVGSWPKFKRVVEAARKARARKEQARRVKSRHGQKK